MDEIKDALADRTGGGNSDNFDPDVSSTTPPPNNLPPLPSPPAGSTRWEQWANENFFKPMQDQGYTDWQIFGIIVAIIVAFFVALCIVNIFLGAIQHASRRKEATDSKLAASGSGDFVNEPSAVISRSRADALDKEK